MIVAKYLLMEKSLANSTKINFYQILECCFKMPRYLTASAFGRMLHSD